MRPSHGFWGTGDQGHLFQGNKGKILRGTKTIFIWGTGNIENKFSILGNMGTSQFISGEQGNRYPPPPWEGFVNFDYGNAGLENDY